VNNLLRDLKVAARALVSQPGFSIVAILTVALGIGSAIAVFTVVNGVLIRALPYDDPDKLLVVWGKVDKTNSHEQPLSWPDFQDYAAQNEVFESLSVMRGGTFTLSDQEQPDRVSGLRATANIFSVLGVRPLIGRTFAAEDGQESAQPVAVISHSLWTRRYSSDASVLGKTVPVDGVPYRIVGVLPAGFVYPGMKYPTDGVELWLPLIPLKPELVRSFHANRSIGRLKAGVTAAQALANFETIANRLAAQYPDSNLGWSVEMSSLFEQVVGKTRAALLMLSGAVAFVVLIVCANLTNLFLTRASSRSGEMSLRTALGAPRSRLAAQCLTEVGLLTGIGAAAGLLLATWSVPVLLRLSPGLIPRVEDIRLDYRVVIFTFLITAVATVLSGLMPALRMSDSSISDSLKQISRTGRAQGSRLQGIFVVSQIAVAMILLIGAGLLLRSFAKVLDVDPGFQPRGVLVGAVGLPQARYPTNQKQLQLYESLLERIRAVPGVEIAAAGFRPPTFGLATANFRIQDKPVPRGSEPVTDYRTGTVNYFKAMQIPLITGRLFDEMDNERSADVIVVNETMARQQWPNESPLGKRVQLAAETTRFREIIGVVGDVRMNGPEEQIKPVVYVPYAQNSWPNAIALSHVIIRTHQEPASIISAVRRELRALDPELVLYQPRPMDEAFITPLAPRRFTLVLLTSFAVLGAILALIGVFGVVSYTVNQRRYEVGVRLALGATRHKIFAQFLKQGAGLTFAGIAAGSAGAIALTQVLGGFLFGVAATDAWTFASVASIFIATSLAACSIPAIRAARIEASLALRAE